MAHESLQRRARRRYRQLTVRAAALLPLSNRAIPGDLEGKAEARQILARMVLREGQLRQPVVVRTGLPALVDRRIEIDEVPARLAGGLHHDLDVALAVEGAGIARNRVVVDHGVDIGGLAPADPLEVDAEGRPGRAAPDVERKCGRGDPQT